MSELALAIVHQPDNGCSVTRCDDWIIGTNPYGLDDLHLRIGDVAARHKIEQWMTFWSQNRDEHGVPLDVPSMNDLTPASM